MDFEISIGDKTETVDQFHLALDIIKKAMAQWNNYDSSRPLIVGISKVKSKTETLGISVDDELKIRDIFGG